MENIEAKKLTAQEKIAELQRRKRALLSKNPSGFYEDIMRYAKMVEARKTDARKYKAFNLLIGGYEENSDRQPFDDFLEPEFSVEKFLDREEEKFNKK